MDSVIVSYGTGEYGVLSPAYYEFRDRETAEGFCQKWQDKGWGFFADILPKSLAILARNSGQTIWQHSSMRKEVN